jgi:translocator protein
VFKLAVRSGALGYGSDDLIFMNTYAWYQSLIKPAFAPPAYVFGPVWAVLYVIIAITFGAVFYKVAKKEIPWMVALPFALNLVFNFAFTPLQFGLQNNTLASLDILLVLGTLIWALTAIYPRLKWVALANIPYLLWVSFATVLQLTITYLNL